MTFNRKEVGSRGGGEFSMLLIKHHFQKIKRLPRGKKKNKKNASPTHDQRIFHHSVGHTASSLISNLVYTEHQFRMHSHKTVMSRKQPMWHPWNNKIQKHQGGRSKLAVQRKTHKLHTKGTMLINYTAIMT